jgi:transposase
LMGCRRLIVNHKVQITNAIRGFLKTYGIRLKSTGDMNFTQKVREKLLDQFALAAESIESLLRCYENLIIEIKQLTNKVEELANSDEDVKRLMTIPGVGPIVALTYKMEIDDPSKFKNSRSVGAYLGMTPKQYSSGETQRQGRISKCGSTEMRTLLNANSVFNFFRFRKKKLSYP